MVLVNTHHWVSKTVNSDFHQLDQACLMKIPNTKHQITNNTQCSITNDQNDASVSRRLPVEPLPSENELV